MICRRCGTEFDSRKYLAADGSTQCPDTNTTTEIMPGYSLTVRTVYTLRDPSAEITFSVAPFLDLLDDYAPLTFTVRP